MISIHKNTPGPRSLTEYAASGGHYDQGSNFSNIKNDIRKALCEEQGFICCYCMRLIEPSPNGMQIAHIKSQSHHPDLDCSYTNMMGSCSCNETCNQKQKDYDLRINPTDLSHPVEELIRYESDGTILSDDAEINEELNLYLNLNSTKQFLKQDRCEILNSVKRELKRTPFSQRIDKAKSLLSFWSSKNDDKYREYCGIAIWFLNERLNKWETR